MHRERAGDDEMTDPRVEAAARAIECEYEKRGASTPSFFTGPVLAEAALAAADAATSPEPVNVWQLAYNAAFDGVGLSVTTSSAVANAVSRAWRAASTATTQEPPPVPLVSDPDWLDVITGTGAATTQEDA
jgi:hypothetical protein